MDFLAQVLPSDANDYLLYSSKNKKSATIKKLVVCNVSGSTPTFRVFASKGSEPSTSTAILYDVAMTANETKIYDLDMKFTGNIHVRASAGNQINFSLFGEES